MILKMRRDSTWGGWALIAQITRIHYFKEQLKTLNNAKDALKFERVDLINCKDDSIEVLAVFYVDYNGEHLIATNEETYIMSDTGDIIERLF